MSPTGVQPRDVVQAWGRILAGHRPNLSVEITKDCPLSCPGCYAYGDEHLGGDVTLRGLSDYKGDELVERFMALVDRQRPLHLSIVGGEPLVRYRELDVILPRPAERGIHTQLVTSAVRPIPAAWAAIRRLQVVVSIDGLAPEHDARRKPATYERILKHIDGHHITVHCTITRQQAQRDGYLEEFLRTWEQNPHTRLIWISLYTPQKPEDCIFAQTTACISSDMERRITPCQFGGDPDCAHCGCLASAGLEAIGRHRIGGGIPLGRIFYASLNVGRAVARLRPAPSEAA